MHFGPQLRSLSLPLTGTHDGLVHFLRRHTLRSGHSLCCRSAVALQSYLGALDTIFALCLVQPLDMEYNGI